MLLECQESEKAIRIKLNKDVDESNHVSYTAIKSEQINFFWKPDLDLLAFTKSYPRFNKRINGGKN